MIESYKSDSILLLIFLGISTFFAWTGGNSLNFIYILILTIMASHFFKFMASPSKGISYLMLPTNAIEKTITAVIITHIIYPFTYGITFFAGNLLGKAIGTMLVNNIFTMENTFVPFSDFSSFLDLYLALSIFLFGSIYFKSHAFRKTLLCVFGIGIIITGIIAIINCKGISLLNIPYYIENWNSGSPLLEQLEKANKLKDASILILSLILIPYFWTMTYIRLKETEA